MYIGIIGSGNYRNKDFVLKTLKKDINVKNDIIVSGHSPRVPYKTLTNEIKYDNVDIWAEDWAKENCRYPPVIFNPEKLDSEHFKKRNNQIAEKVKKLICFIPYNQYRSGTWNTINEFLKMGKNIEDIYIYDEFERLWNIDKYPVYIQKRYNDMDIV
jgi:hypothetical protein